MSRVIAIILIALLSYTIIGTGERVDEIKSRAPADIENRGWEIMRYEGWQYGRFGSHGGKVWYHVRNKDDHNIQYRVYVTIWGGELHYVYGEPEKLQIINVSADLTDTQPQ